MGHSVPLAAPGDPWHEHGRNHRERLRLEPHIDREDHGVPAEMGNPWGSASELSIRKSRIFCW